MNFFLKRFKNFFNINCKSKEIKKISDKDFDQLKRDHANGDKK